MSDRPSPAARFLESWRWLRPELRLTRAGLDARLWPDLGRAGRDRRVELARVALQELSRQDENAESLEQGHRLLARRLLEREISRAALPPHRLDLAGLVARALGPAALAADPGQVQERLRRLPELLDPLREPGFELAGDTVTGALAARRLRALAQHLEARLPWLTGGAATATEALSTLAGELESLPAAVMRSEEDAWADLQGEGAWELAPLLERIEAELTRAGRELERRALVLQQRFDSDATGDALRQALAQLARDLPQPERWAWLHEGLQADLARALRRLGLEVEPPRVATAPGLLPGWTEPGLEEAEAGLWLPDLSQLNGADLAAHLADRNHGLLPLLAAREGLPGRAWLLARLRARGDGSLSEAVAACLLEPEDLDAWARWAGDWMVRAAGLGGDARLRLLQKREELRDLLLARADLELRLGIRPETEIRQRLAHEGGLPTHLAEAAWLALRRRPGRFAAASARLLDFREAGRRWRHAPRGAAAGSADWLLILADCAALPGPWLRRHLHLQPARGEQLLPQPPALVRPSGRSDGLLSEMEERLAALGRIRREDLEAGREFDAPLVALDEADDAPAE